MSAYASNLYSYSNSNSGTPVPPPPVFFIVDMGGNQLIDMAGNDFITPEGT